MANDSIRGRQVVLRLTNKSGGGLVEGDVVIVDSTTAASVTTTTTAGLNTDVIGVALETIAGDAIGRIAITGYVPKVNLSGSASLGDSIATHTVAKQAAPNATRGAGAFGEVLGTGTTPAALLWGLPDPSGAGGMAADALWDAAGDLAIGTGANTGGRLAIGTAYQTLRVNVGATALEYVSDRGRALIGELTPTGTGTASWALIPGTYWKLVFEGIIKSTDTDAGDLASISMYFNADTTATNYRRTRLNSYATTTTGTEGGDDAIIGKVSNDSTVAGSATQFHAEIINYAGTTYNKSAQGHFASRTEASTQEVGIVFYLNWESNVAITQVDLVLAAGNYKAGTVLRCYGVH